MPTLSDIGAHFNPLQEFIRQTGEEVQNLGQRLDSTRRQVTQNAQQIDSAIETLREGMAGIRTEVQALLQGISQLASTTAQNRRNIQQEASVVTDLYEVYKRLGVELKTLEGVKSSLEKSDKEMAKIQQLNDDYLRAQVGSVAKLEAQYKLLDEVWKNMSATQRKENPQIAESMREIYEMIKLVNSETTKVSTGEGTFKGLGDIFERVGVKVETLSGALRVLEGDTHKSAQVQQLYTQLLQTQEGSYDNLATKYKLVKVLHNAMSTAEVAENQEVATSLREIYEQMNLIQQRTGKYQLQVGDYSKAMTGLNIATNQVVRELPVLANGVSMFAIAISNNIPILVDNIEQVSKAAKAQRALKQEYLDAAAKAQLAGEAMEAASLRQQAASVKVISAGKALVSTVLSWQTALVLVLTVLPNIIRNIEKKRKAQQELNSTTKESIEYEKLLADAYKETGKEQERSIAKLQTLYFVTQDQLRSYDDRIKAAQLLKQEYEKEFENLGEEEILLGRAKTAYDQLTASLVEQAKARAYLNKITALQEQMLDQQAIRDQAKAQKEAADAEVARWDAMIKRQIELGNTGEGLAYFSSQLSKATKKQEEANSAFIQADAPLQEIDNAILKLQQDIPVNGLMAELLGGRGGRGDQALKVSDYYNQALENIINNMGDAFQKQMALLELELKKQRESYENHRQELLKIQREGSAQEREEATTQLSNLNLALVALEQHYIEERKRLIKELVDSYKTEVQDEGDVEEEQMKRLQVTLKAEQRLRETAAYEVYEMSERTARDKEALDQAIRDSERQYWEEYLAQLREAGILTVQEYNNIMSNLAKAAKEGESAMSRGRRGRKYGGLFEAILAQTKTYGEGNKFGQGILKEEYSNFVTSLDDALKTSMGYMDEWMDKRLEMAQVAVDAAQREVEATKKYLDFELETRANGYANRVETARKEVELARKQHKEALAEQKRIQQQQLALDAISQTSSLITATANIWEAMTKGTGPLGPVLATTATALLWGSFAASKVKAAQLAGLKAEQYGEGTVQLLQGGSHASGHDIDLGHKSDGTPRRAEGGEFFAVINKRNSRKYRNVIPEVINSFNDGTFGERYQRAIMGDYALSVMGGATDVSTLEKDVAAIRSQGQETRFVDAQGNTVVKYKNLTRRIRN